MSEQETEQQDGAGDATAGDREEARSNWEFWDQPPTVDQVRELLETLRPVYGVKTVDYIDYVQPLSQSKKIDGARDERGRRGPATYRDTWSLYMSVGGRIAMLSAAQELNGWEVDFRPEMHPGPDCPTGYLEFTDRIVYREYCVITQFGVPMDDSKWAARPDQLPLVLGSKPGTAWVPRSGGSQAKGSNPYEKVETAARGRSIGAWGFGVLPGTGVASLEEMMGVAENRAAVQAEGGPQQEREAKKTQPQWVEECKTLAEEVRQVRNIDTAAMDLRVAEFLSRIGVPTSAVWQELPTDDTAGVPNIQWDRIKPGQLQLMANSFRETIKAAKMDASMAGEQDQ